ncbi:MAG TPA: S8 family serine peptidase, partial [Candidatus Kapabacteria bacterium]|nr:S8 family serine peptidase [Candidatus Kapabacteria bacterium]
MNTLRILNLRVISVFLLLLASPVVVSAQQAATPDSLASYAGRVPGIVYVQFRAGYLPAWGKSNGAGVVAGSEDPVQKIFREIGVDSIVPFDRLAWKDSISHRLGIDRIYDVYYSNGAQPLGVVVRLLQTGLVETASPRYIFKPQIVPNDPALLSGQQYYIKNIDAEDAWTITYGDSNVIIADVDEGVNVNHEDLKGNIKFNPGETGLDAQGHDKRTNGQDNDGDGYINDWEGWNTALNNNVVTPPPCGSDCEGDHGTMTTGCFGAVANNGIGIAGVAPGCKILVVRISNDQGQLTGAYEGIHYASTYCAKYARHAVINNSWGGRTDAEALPFASIFPQEVTARGQVCVASAGNYALDNDITPFYPACVPGVLSVGATDENDKPTSFTHYGHIVSVFAPGIDIYTTTTESPELNTGYTEPTVAGTSFSGPIVAGIAGLLFSSDTSLSPDAVKKRIIETCDPIPNKDPYLYHGRVNAFEALNIPPSPSLAIQNYSVGFQVLGTLGAIGSTNALSVNFINVGADGSNLTAQIQPGAGYTWPGYNPVYQSTWTTDPIAIIGKNQTVSTPFQIIRTGEFSEGSINVNFVVNDQAPPDTLSVRVALTQQPGMTHRLLVQHATCVRQVDAVNGWAGFGYYLNYLDPERGTDSTILVSQYSVRGDTGWSLPIDIPGGEPIYSMDAIDKDHAWFASNTDIYATASNGTAPNDISSPGGPIRSIHFSDANNGILIGDASSGKWNIQTTTDGGNNWTPSVSAPLAGHATQSFYNASCWVGKDAWFGTDSGIFRSTNGGSQWFNTQITGATKKQKDVMAITFSSDASLGYAAIRPFAGDISNADDPDSAGLFYSLSKGVDWIQYSPTQTPTGFIPYSIAFIPGTDTAIITSNMGIFKLGKPGDALTSFYLPAPTSFDARSSQVSVGGVSGTLTISAVSLASGIADYAVGSPSGVSNP